MCRLESDLEQNIRILPDVSVDILLNKSGSVRATFFYTRNTDLLIDPTQSGKPGQRAGTKLSYRREFGSLSEMLFGRKKGQRKGAAKDSTSMPQPTVSN